MKFKLVIIGLMIFLLTSLSNAEMLVDNDASIKSSSNINADSIIKMCSCSIESTTIKILNSKSELELYDLSANFDFITLKPANFELLPGESKEVNITINAPCEEVQDTLSIYVFNSNGFQGQINKQLQIGKCQNLKAFLFADKNTFKPCELMEHEILIQNPGQFTEEYKITSSTSMDAVSLLISPKEEKKVLLNTTLGCELYGNQTITFFVEAVNNALITDLTHEVFIIKDYNFSIQGKETLRVCEESSDKDVFTIEKYSASPNTYNLKLVNAPNFINLSKNKIELQKDQDSVEVELVYDILEDKNIGNYSFSIEAQSEYGEIVKRKNLTLKVQDCYELSARILLLEDEFCAEKQQFELLVENKGTLEQNIQLSGFSEGLIVSNQEFIVDAGTNKTINAEFLPEDKTGKYDLDFDLIHGGNYYNNTQKISQEVSVLSLWDCYKVNVRNNKQSFRYYENSSFELTLNHEGLKGGLYKVGAEADSVIPFTSLNSVNRTDYVELYPGESMKFYINMNYSKADIGIHKGDVSVSFKGLDYSEEIQIKIKDKSLCLKTYEYFMENPCHLLSAFFILLIIFFIFFVLFSKKRRTKLKRRKFNSLLFTLATVLIISAACILFSKGLPYLNEPIDYTNQSESYYIWAEEEDYTVPVESLVEDPDKKDELSLQLLEPNENINMSYVEKQLIFHPKENWHGTETVQILAKDDKGAFAISPEITLKVVRRQDYTCFQAYDKLCLYINWVLLVILSVLALIASYKLFRKKPKKPGRKNSSSRKNNKRR